MCYTINHIIIWQVTVINHVIVNGCIKCLSPSQGVLHHSFTCRPRNDWQALMSHLRSSSIRQCQIRPSSSCSKRETKKYHSAATLVATLPPWASSKLFLRLNRHKCHLLAYLVHLVSAAASRPILSQSRRKFPPSLVGSEAFYFFNYRNICFWLFFRG